VAASKVEWRRTVSGLKYTYEVSSTGRVRRALVEERKPACSAATHGYELVTIGGKNYTVHRLVAEAFLGPRPQGKVVNHKDGNKRNNNATNLEYVTHRENIRHAFKLGLISSRKGERNNATKLTAHEVKIMRVMRDFGVPLTRLADMFDVAISNVHQIVARQTWTHI
jgi:hypothetical protein